MRSALQLLSSADPIIQPSDASFRQRQQKNLRSSPAFHPVHNGSAQLSYFIYSCTVRTQAQCHATAQSHHARMNLRPNVLCIRSTMSNSQRTTDKIQRPSIDHPQFFLSQSLEVMVGQGRFELPTSRLSSARSNQLSY